MASVLITGGAGAIGSRLAARFLAAGYDVTVLDDLSSGYTDLVPDGVTFVRGSITEPGAVEKAFSPRPTYVCHLAALFANQNSVDHPEKDLIVNGLGTLHVLEACRRAGVQKLLFASSSCVYSGFPFEEHVGISYAATPYAATKWLGENYVQFYQRQYSLPTVTVRLFNSYGPGEKPGQYRNVIPNWIARALAGLPLEIYGDGSDTRDFTYVSDIVEGMWLAVTRRTASGAVFNLASGRETVVRDLASLINDLTRNRAPVTFLPGRGWDLTARRCGNITAAREQLEYEPRVQLPEGLARTIDWHKALRK